MKVMLVKPIETFEEGMENAPYPEVGDKDTVIDSTERYGRVYYFLKRFGHDHGYISNHFATLPEQSADEMAIEQHEAIIYQR